HHATLHSVEYLAQRGEVSVQFVDLLPDGNVNVDHLESLLSAAGEKTLVSLMHANNETGNVLDIQSVGALCRMHGAIFHSDTVQTVGHFPFNLSQTPVDFITAAAHKFHG